MSAPETVRDPTIRWRELLRQQASAFTRRQAAAQGFTAHAIGAQLAARRWQQPVPRVFVAFTGPLPRPTRRWVALLYAGEGAVLSHRSAAALWGLCDERPDDVVHVTIPVRRRVRSLRDVVVHRSRLPDTGRDPGFSPPRTTAEATVCDLAAGTRRIADALALVASACRLGITTETRLLHELERRPTHRFRADLRLAVQDAAAGAHSVLELRYLRAVERAHRLPAGVRQRRVGATVQDVHYVGCATVVELDGRLGHADARGVWRDMARDNASSVRGETTLRYGWADVVGRPCDVAAQVAAVLNGRGWAGRLHPCGPACPAAKRGAV